MKAGFIGAGKVGFSLGKLFSENGIQVTGYYSRSQESAAKAAAFTNSKQFVSLEDIVKESNAIFLTVPDGIITSVYNKLLNLEIKDKQICHCSGALSARDAFPGLDSNGAYGYSIHPLFPVSDRLTSYREMSDAFFCIEGEGPHLHQWESILNKICSGVQIISPNEKVKYHAACAISSNLICGLVYESLTLLKECGFNENLALRALTPLIMSNTEHILLHGPVEALTGPIERCDSGTIEKHLSILEAEGDKAIYRSVSQKLIDIAQKKHPETDYSLLRNVLEEK